MTGVSEYRRAVIEWPRGASVVFLLVAVIAVCPQAAAQHGQTGLQNPFTMPADVEAGRKLYLANCAVCHGIEGRGGRGPDLTRGVFRRGGSDGEIYRTIANGVPGTEMPPVSLEGRQTWQVVAYMRALGSTGLGQVQGDAANGKVLFEGKAGCATCHSVGGSGGRLGPDLSTIGRRTSAAQLEASLLRPGERVLAEHWRVRAVTREGREVTGLRLNEDTQSVQLLDSSERLVSLQKSGLRQYQIVKESAMPSYEGKLTRRELDDIMSYLAALGAP